MRTIFAEYNKSPLHLQSPVHTPVYYSDVVKIG